MRRTYAAACAAVLTALSTVAFAAADTAKFGFEKGTQGWAVDASPGSVSTSTAKHFAGASALAIKVAGNKLNRVSVMNPGVPAGKTVTFHVWLPATGIKGVQPFAQDKGYAWIGHLMEMRTLKGNAWNTLAVKVPATAKVPIWKVGIEVTGDGKSSPTVYVDSVNW